MAKGHALVATKAEALDSLLALLRRSEDSVWSAWSVLELVAMVEALRSGFADTGVLEPETLSFLLLPAGPLQDISIDNGWGKEFNRLAEVLEG